jgi:hypothetical protein
VTAVIGKNLWYASFVNFISSEAVQKDRVNIFAMIVVECKVELLLATTIEPDNLAGLVVPGLSAVTADFILQLKRQGAVVRLVLTCV